MILKFDYSHCPLQATLDRASKPKLDIVMEAYPVGNNPMYPNKRIFTNRKGDSFELNDTRLSTWAAHLAQATPGVDESNPPNSLWFDVKHALHSPNSVALSTAAATTPTIATVTAPIIATTPTTTAAPSIRDQFLDMAMLSMLQNITQPQGSMLAPTLQPVPGPLAPNNSASLPSSPAQPQPQLQHVSLDEFCSFYSLSDTDKSRLSELEYCPENRAIETLDPKDWKDVGFKPLSWSNVIETHRKFLKDVRKGTWDHLVAQL